MLGFSLLGVIAVLAVEEDAPVMKKEFSAEVRALREEIFNLRQQALEQRIFNATAEFANSIILAQGSYDPNIVLTACAEARANSALFTNRWQVIQDFWPLGSSELLPLVAFNKNIQEFCAPAAEAQ